MVTITGVEERSRAARAGIVPGDVLLEINGREITDVLDYRFRLTARVVTLSLSRNGEEFAVTIHKGEYNDIGLDFETPLMDKKHSCENRCIFCFIDQLPPGMRKTLYFKDDDSRLSFLHGNYITLTNLSDHDIDRIIEMHISPVNVSVHTTNPELRVSMMHNKHAGEVLRYLDRLAAAGIALCGQIVLCRGINDGAELDRSMHDLVKYVPSLRSVSIVPAGLTRYREKLYPLTLFSREESAAVIRQVEAFAEECLGKYGSRLFFCSDEFYLNAGLSLHDEEYYVGFPQFENGVGLLCRLKDEYETAVRLDPDEGQAEKRKVIMACGTSVAPFLQDLVTRHPVSGVEIQIKPIINYFFGETVTVSGLITGQDLVAQLKGEKADEILITESMLRQGEEIFLDDMTLEQAQQQLGIRITPVPDDGADLLYALRGTEE